MTVALTETGPTALAARCSDTAAARGDDLVGTAPANRRFLLIEQPGPWGRIALEQSQLDRGVGARLAADCGESRTRPLLIRRPGRTEPVERKRWFLAVTTPGAATLRTGTVGNDEELIELLSAASPGERCDVPLYAVCTHGRHDTCCAIKGRPVARALAETLGDAAWEVSHLGGDRFAGNLLVLPQGLYYGRVDSANVGEIVAATDRDDVVPGLLRGSSAFAPAAQAAQAFVRAETGDNRIDAFPTATVMGMEEQRFVVTLDEWTVTVQRHAAGPPAFLTCAAKVRLAPPEWSLLELRRV